MEFTLELLVELAGDLEDGSRPSEKLREKLQAEATTADIDDLLQEALAGTESYHNRALQDIVNNIGQRLGFEVEYGPYRPNSRPRYDGLWQSRDLESEEVSLVVETKKSAGFQINPNKQPGSYMDHLVAENGLDASQVYGLIVVGEDDDDIGGVVDAVRGSEYRKRIRVITCHQLYALLAMADEGGLSRHQTAQVLLPMDTVNVGSLVDLIEKIVEGRTPDPRQTEFWRRCEAEAGVVREEGSIELQPVDGLAAAERLRTVVGIAIDTEHLTTEELPYHVSGGDRCLVNSAPEHPTGTAMRRPAEVREGFFVECNHSADQIERRIQAICAEVTAA